MAGRGADTDGAVTEVPGIRYDGAVAIRRRAAIQGHRGSHHPGVGSTRPRHRRLSRTAQDVDRERRGTDPVTVKTIIAITGKHGDVHCLGTVHAGCLPVECPGDASGAVDKRRVVERRVCLVRKLVVQYLCVQGGGDQLPSRDGQVQSSVAIRHHSSTHGHLIRVRRARGHLSWADECDRR